MSEKFYFSLSFYMVTVSIIAEVQKKNTSNMAAFQY